MKKFTVATGLAAALLLSLPAPTPAKSSPPADRNVVARVNGQPLYAEQLAPLLHSEQRNFRITGSRAENPLIQSRLRERAMEQLITQELIRQAVRDIHPPNLEAEVEKRFKDLRPTPPSEDHSAVRERLRVQIRYEEYLRGRNLLSPAISDDEVRAYYEEIKENWRQEEKVEVRHILVALAEDAPAKEVEAARKMIEEARKALLKKGAFAEVAGKYSDCNSASAGGELGMIQRGYMPPEFEEVAFSLKSGTLSPVVRTRFGFHLLEVTGRQEAGIVPYDQLKDFLTRHLRNEKSRKLTAEHLQKLRENARIEIVNVPSNS